MRCCYRLRGGVRVSPGAPVPGCPLRAPVPCCGQLVSALRVCQVSLRCRCRADGDLLAGQSPDSPPGQPAPGAGHPLPCWHILTPMGAAGARESGSER